MSRAFQDYRAILQQLFPSMDSETLAKTPRDKLLEMINRNAAHLPHPPSPAISQGVDAQLTPTTADCESLEALQTMPEENSDGQESRSNAVIGISDDVNAFSLSVKQSSSYQGISSIMAVLRVILWIDPDSQSYFCRTPDRTALQSREHSSPPDMRPAKTLQPHSSFTDGLILINAYFIYVHALFPLIDERTFRDTYFSGKRNDGRWWALLNMVFAMGSVAAFTSNDSAHEGYFLQAKKYLGIDCLGNTHLETVQALGLMGGYYLHYVQRPNLANAIMGATLRMATTLGLHREYVDNRTGTSDQNHVLSVDLRRRVWWSLFVMDTWATMTLGRPSMGRWSHAITAKAPQYSDDSVSTWIVRCNGTLANGL